VEKCFAVEQVAPWVSAIAMPVPCPTAIRATVLAHALPVDALTVIGIGIFLIVVTVTSIGAKSAIKANLFRSCQCCGKTNVCKDCGSQGGICKRDCQLCKSCQEQGRCSECKTYFCLCCMKGSMKCSKCSKRFCVKSDCVDKVKQCGACNKTLCLGCGTFEDCSGCKKSYCMDHCRLVDCNACDMRHCRSCKHVKRCNLCGLACFEGCDCADETKASKKATIS